MYDILTGRTPLPELKQKLAESMGEEDTDRLDDTFRLKKEQVVQAQAAPAAKSLDDDSEIF